MESSARSGAMSLSDLISRFFSVFGIVALTGVVVNDSLVMVDFINRQREKGHALSEALREAGVVRFRPILLTSVTTFLGLTPLLLEKSPSGAIPGSHGYIPRFWRNFCNRHHPLARSHYLQYTRRHHQCLLSTHRARTQRIPRRAEQRSRLIARGVVAIQKADCFCNRPFLPAIDKLCRCVYIALTVYKAPV